MSNSVVVGKHTVACRTLLAVGLGIAMSAGATPDMFYGRTPSPAKPRPAGLLKARLSRSGAGLEYQSRAPALLLTQGTRTVTTCDDVDMPGGLRYEVANAVSGDIIDLSALVCGSITLSGAKEIQIPQASLHVKGPTDHALTIDAALQSRIFLHAGVGTLEVENLTIANGVNVNDADPHGGCISSHGSVTLRASSVTGCLVQSDAVTVYGGGVSVEGDLALYDSSIRSSQAKSSLESFGGGAVVIGNLRAYGSVVDSNSALPLDDSGTGVAGGLAVVGTIHIVGSTVSRNSATFTGGIDLEGYGGIESGVVLGSTISGNSATATYGGVWTITPLAISSSTIAFNRAGFSNPDTYAGIHVSHAALTIQSSIVTGNTGLGSTFSDIGGSDGATLDATSSHNIVISSNFPLPADTIGACARLQPLSNNGGNTLTHALSYNSPALDKGSPGGLIEDQRGAPRVVNGAADIGSVERQPGEIDEQIMAGGFDNDCS